MIDQLELDKDSVDSDPRAAAIFAQRRKAISEKTDKMFSVVLLLQWAYAIGCAFWFSPRSWDGDLSSTHLHFYIAVFLVGALTLYPCFVIWTSPGRRSNAYVVAVAQMATSIALIHLAGGRVETHFHIFGSLAILAAYRDWKVLILASAFTAADHFLRGALFASSIYGVPTASSLRALEHTLWVVFEDVFLLVSMRTSIREMRDIASRQAHLERAFSSVENQRSLETTRSEKLLQSIINSMPSLVAYLDLNLNYRFVNSMYEKFFGNALERIKRGDGAQLISQEKNAELLKKRRQALEGIGSNFDLTLPLPSGEQRFLDVHYIPDVDERKQVRGCIVLGHDITERMRAQQIIEEQQAELVIASKLSALGEMAGGVAHEINTPLASIQLLNESLRVELESTIPDFEALTETSDSIDKTVVRISKIVNGLRAISRDGTGEASADHELSVIIEDTLSLCREKFRAHGVELLLNCPENLTIECRPVQISQVLLNLLNNAYDSIQDRAEKWVRISVEDLTSAVRIAVVDSGDPIPEKIREKLFLPFFTTKDIGKGTGIGLSISKTIVEAHGGSLGVDVADKNAAFVFVLPKKKQARAV